MKINIELNHAQILETIRILRSHAESCDTYQCAEEARETRSLAKVFESHDDSQKPESATAEEAFGTLTERQCEAMPLVFAVLGAACVSHDVSDVIAVVHKISQHPRLLSETIGLTSEALDGKGDELMRRVDHPAPKIVDEPTEPT